MPELKGRPVGVSDLRFAFLAWAIGAVVLLALVGLTMWVVRTWWGG